MYLFIIYTHFLTKNKNTIIINNIETYRKNIFSTLCKKISTASHFLIYI